MGDDDWGNEGEWGVADESSEEPESASENDSTAESDSDGASVIGILVMLAIGGGLIYGGLSLQAAQPAAADTVPIEATVVESDYSQRGSGTDRKFVIHVTYEFQYEGETHRSSNVRAGPSSYTVDTERRAKALTTEQWAPSNTIDAEMDPSNPDTSYLVEYRRGSKFEESIGHYLLLAFGGLAILASLVSIGKKARRHL